MGGHAAIRAVGSILHDVPIVLTSGYDPEPDSMSDAEGRTVSFLKKPYRRSELARCVREILTLADSDQADSGRCDADRAARPVAVSKSPTPTSSPGRKRGMLPLEHP